MALTNRLELITMVADYIHRDDINAQIGGFIDLVTARLGRDLQSSENEITGAFNMATNPQPLPSDFRAIRELTYNSGAGVVFVKPAGLKELARYSGNNAGGGAAYYAIKGTSLQTSPTRLGDYNLTYYAEPDALTGDTSTNDVLLVYPYLYLYGALKEAFFYIQDGDGFGAANAQYQNELKRVNILSEQARVGRANAMRA